MLLSDDLRLTIRGQMPDVISNLRAKAGDKPAPAREAGYTIHNATGDEATVRIYDEIWWLGVNAMDLTAELDRITAPNITVEINSPGGDVFDGIAIYNALRLHPAKVTTRVDGLAASIASVIAQAGDHRIMVAASQMMIHNAWGMTVGDSGDHKEMAALLAHQDGILADIYATKAPKDAGYFRGLMDAETWMTAAQAVAEGLADEILDPARPVKDSLHTQIAAAVDAVDVAVTSSEAVTALRAEAGKTLSVVNRESLVGLRASLGRIDGLLQDEVPAGPSDAHDAQTALAMRTAAFQAALPPEYLG